MNFHSTAPTEPRFNLIDEPWIPIRRTDGEDTAVSISDAFHHAEDISAIGGDVATQTFAITRLLLAIHYRATIDDSPTGWDATRWATFWNDGLPLPEIDDYLDLLHDRFYLIHPTRPFFQVPALSTARGEIKDTGPLILDLPSNNRLFTNRSGAAALRLPFAEAARWLVNAQAFDPSGIKSGAVGDDRVKNGKGYPLGLAWSGLLGGVLLTGRNLQETLLLNLDLPREEDDGFDADNDLPPWEDDVPDTAAARDLRPTGPVRLYTWQSRRIRLVAEGSEMTGCVLSNGDALTPQNQHRHEPMTAWRFSEPQTKKHGEKTFMPKLHTPDRALWRGIGALLPGLQNDDARSGKPVRTLQTIGTRRAYAELPSDLVIGVRAIGVVYGSNNSVVDDIIDDTLSLKVALLREEHRELAAEADTAVSLAEDGVRALGRLHDNLQLAAGGSRDDDSRRQVQAMAYAELEPLFRTWLATIDEASQSAEIIGQWKRIAAQALRSLGQDLVRDAGPAAWSGREVRTLNKTDFIASPRAEGWFHHALRNTFGSPETPHTDAPDGPTDHEESLA